MSVRETMMRKAIKADERLPFEELFFRGTFDTPLTMDRAGKLAIPLEMVRLAPSAAFGLITSKTRRYKLKSKFIRYKSP